MKSAPTVVVGMSGGVDSSVCALLLKQQGHRVIGLFMKNWEEDTDEGTCTTVADFEDVVRVCEKIDIPYYSVNFAQEYREQVFSHFIQELRQGHTPNPDILCNKEIKFKVLLEKALEIGGDFLATGHYCRKSGNKLFKGIDGDKDQSYFLYTIKDHILERVLFPIGEMKKNQVREIARQHGLATAEKKDSTGVCFIGERNFKQFISRYIPFQPGNFEDIDGNIVGQHDGVAHYTIGQRKGLGIGGPGEAWFVVSKDIPRNVIILAQGETHPALFCNGLVASDLTWIDSDQSPQFPFRCKAKIRYRQADQDCVIEKIENGLVYVSFPTPQRAVTLRQSIVFYDGDRCLGGAVIHAKNKFLPQRAQRQGENKKNNRMSMIRLRRTG